MSRQSPPHPDAGIDRSSFGWFNFYCGNEEAERRLVSVVKAEYRLSLFGIGMLFGGFGGGSKVDDDGDDDDCGGGGCDC